MISAGPTFAQNGVVDFGSSVPSISQLREAFGGHSRIIVERPPPSRPSQSVSITNEPSYQPAARQAPAVRAPAVSQPSYSQPPSGQDSPQGASVAIQFAYNSASVLPTFRPHIASFAAYLREDPGLRLTIVGHTDATGSDEYNLNLSQERAQSVFNILVNDYKIDSQRLSVEGHGESQLRYSRYDSRNRRVEFLKNI